MFQMRFTKKVAVWPVGLVTHLRAEGCIVTNGKVHILTRATVTTPDRWQSKTLILSTNVDQKSKV